MCVCACANHISRTTEQWHIASKSASTAFWARLTKALTRNPNHRLSSSFTEKREWEGKYFHSINVFTMEKKIIVSWNANHLIKTMFSSSQTKLKSMTGFISSGSRLPLSFPFPQSLHPRSQNDLLFSLGPDWFLNKWNLLNYPNALYI